VQPELGEVVDQVVDRSLLDVEHEQLLLGRRPDSAAAV
jgi:hypothetical protein